ncbi:divalent-cation tolerance protein CutA [Lutimaribacter saemankumensis]|uniref:Divalent cation tolerance protein n=1 Tax=Lutimaribacter saemankumensis TaxID=490829 RepID=A0A1G8M7A3_9RHOB|nr:divalent-cation tolerance protein CutA [Lutimaribacter saemankumensis]SDI63859.1 divalent cation tolerance protein [Lutimaribacter saemankumensis]
MIHLSTTCPDIDSARDIASAALQARLAACANITPGVISLFHWKGAVEEEAEVHLLLKTGAAHVAALAQLVAEEHPYDLPVITWEEVQTTPEAADWLDLSTRG